MTASGVLRGDEFVGTAELRKRAARAATGLSELGVGPGDTVGLLLRNDHPIFEASCAAAMLGAASVPVNWHGSSNEINYVLRDCKAKVLVAHADLLGPKQRDLPVDIAVLGVPTPPDIADAYGIDSDSCALPSGVANWTEWRDALEPWDGDPAPQPMTMIYTSGTTGMPKGVRRLPGTADDASIAALNEDVQRVLGLSRGVRTLITSPMYHSAPNKYALTAMLMDGVVVVHTRFDAQKLLADIEIHAIEALHLVPTMFHRLLQLPAVVRERFDLSSLRHVVHAAAPCPPDLKRAMIDWFGPIIWEYYGATETGAVVACDSNEWLAHPGTVGRPLATCAVSVYHDNGDPCPLGVPGEIFMRAAGQSDFTYQDRPEARAEVERDGLITAGDVGFFDDGGFLHLCDRKRDMIISGGVNIYSAEIEACLLQLPGVRDCAVFGVPDPEFGESVAAAIDADPAANLDASMVRAHVRASLASFKAPKVVEFHPQLPREDSGKVFKRLLREPHWQESKRAI